MILEYVKGFLILFLLMKVLLYFVPKNVFRKYISFFSGIILVIGLLQPVLWLFGQDGEMLQKVQDGQLQYWQWEEELGQIEAGADALLKEGEQFLSDYYYETTEVQTEIESIWIEDVVIEKETQNDYE